MTNSDPSQGAVGRLLATVERVGNKLPDPAVLFIGLLVLVWLISWPLSYIDFGLSDPRNGEPLRVVNQLSATSFTAFMAAMVKNFSHFHPIGVVLVASRTRSSWGLGGVVVVLGLVWGHPGSTTSMQNHRAV